MKEDKLDQKKLIEKKEEIEKIKNLLVDYGLECSEIIDGKYTFTEEEDGDLFGWYVGLFINENGSKRIEIRNPSREDRRSITIRCPPGCQLRYYNIPRIVEVIIPPDCRYCEKGDVYHQLVFDCHIKEIRLQWHDNNDKFWFDIEGPEPNECP